MSTAIEFEWEPDQIGFLPTLHPGLRTLVVGAGEAGRTLARDLRRVDAFGLSPIGFLDDDPSLRIVRRLPVLGQLKDLLRVCAEQRVQIVVLAIPGLPTAEVRRLAMIAARVGASVRHLPSFVALLQRDVVGTDLRSLQVGSLIGRLELHVQSPELRETLHGKRVLVTGAGGSIGSELCRQIGGYEPARLVMLDHDESNLHRLQLELDGEALLDTDDVVVADIRDAERMLQVVGDCRPDIIFHAAALKHLPMLERYPCEAVKSNVLGTQNVVRAAVAHRVSQFVFISTDKAADPSSVLGATKQLAELIVKGSRTSETIMSAVRFGNVLGSRGSLLTILSEQMRSGEAVTVTHPDVTRYFMTIEEAVGLVLEASRLAAGGETFVLDMGEPVRIVDLVANFANQLHLSCEQIRFTGLRPGEKLHEALFSETEERLPTAHPRIYSTRGSSATATSEQSLHDLYQAAWRNATPEVLHHLSALLPTYTVPTGISDSDGPSLVSAAIYPDDY